MATEVIMPVLGMTMESGIIVEWMKKEGDSVTEGEVLFNVETDKSVMEVEARAAGTLLKILHGPGDEVPIQQVIGYIGSPGETIAGNGDGDTGGGAVSEAVSSVDAAGAGAIDAPGDDTPAIASPEQNGQGMPVMAETDGRPDRIKISPKARKHARDLGVAIVNIVGTGPGGRIVFSDVEAYAAQAPATAPAPSAVPAMAGPGSKTRTESRAAQRATQGGGGTACRKRFDRTSLLPYHGRGHDSDHQSAGTTPRLR